MHNAAIPYKAVLDRSPPELAYCVQRVRIWKKKVPGGTTYRLTPSCLCLRRPSRFPFSPWQHPLPPRRLARTRSRASGPRDRSSAKTVAKAVSVVRIYNRGTPYLIQQHQEDDIVSEARQPMQPRHLDDESKREKNDSVSINEHSLIAVPVATHAKKSSTTVLRVLYTIAFQGICATLCNTREDQSPLFEVWDFLDGTLSL